MEEMKMERNPQARAPKTQPFGQEAFAPQENTVIRWLGNAGALINSRGTTLMIDPLLEGFDLPLLIDMPVEPGSVSSLDAVLLTHSDNDHFSRATCRALGDRCREYHAPRYVASLVREMGLNGVGHGIGEIFSVGDVRVTLTPADHAWQNDTPGLAGRVFQREDFCGFWLETKDGCIWAVGDSRLLPEHLAMNTPDAILFDFSDNSWHIGLENAVKLAGAYPETPLILWHWGSVDAPDMDPFNGDPEELKRRIVNPERALVLAPGEPFELRPLKGA